MKTSTFLKAGLACQLAALLAGAGCGRPQAPGETFDLLIRNGRVVDGTGNPWFRADVGVNAGRISMIGNLSAASGKSLIDAEGLVVSPGFIDIHNHSDLDLTVDSRAESMVRQGVTTMVIGNCGESGAPSKEWPTVGAYLAGLEKKGVAVNVSALVGHGNLREVVLNAAGRLPTPEELEKMKALVAQAMKDGAIGLSSALAYAPGMFADTEEMVELCRVVARHGGIYATHIRSDGPAWEKSVREAIETSEKSGVPLQISHLESHYPNWGQQDRILRLLEETRARGLEVTTDIPPYLCGQTGIYTLLPPWALDGGTPRIVERLRNPAEREKIKEWIMTKKEEHVMPTATLVADGHPENIWIVRSRKNPDCSGKNFAEIGAIKGKDPLDAVLDVIAEEEAYMSIVMEHHFEEDMRRLIAHPLSMIETDGHALAPRGPLGEGSPHPRCYGTFPLLFRKYVRGETRVEEPREPGQKLLSLEEAVRKSTSFPAQKLRFRDRGLVREGMQADIVIFDPLTITDKATYANPHQFPEGIAYVLVNGQVVVERGNQTDRLAGRVLRGPGYAAR